MKNDFYQFLTSLRRSITQKYGLLGQEHYQPTKNDHIFAVEEASKLLKYIIQNPNGFTFIEVSVSIGKLILYTLHELEDRTPTTLLASAITYSTLRADDFNLLKAQESLELFIFNTLYKETISQDDLCDILRHLHITIRDIKLSSLCVFILNEEVKSQRMIRDRLIDTILNAELLDPTLNTNELFEEIRGEIQFNSVKKYHEHHQLF